MSGLLHIRLYDYSTSMHSANVFGSHEIFQINFMFITRTINNKKNMTFCVLYFTLLGMCTDEIRIKFSSRDDHTCSTSLFNLDEDMELSAWSPNIIIGENKFTARLGPSGGARGYMAITGKDNNIDVSASDISCLW